MYISLGDYHYRFLYIATKPHHQHFCIPALWRNAFAVTIRSYNFMLFCILCKHEPETH